MIKTLTKDQLDNSIAHLNTLEAKSKKTAEDKSKIKELQKKLDIDARRVVWNTRGIKVIVGGKAKAA